MEEARLVLWCVPGRGIRWQSAAAVPAQVAVCRLWARFLMYGPG